MKSALAVVLLVLSAASAHAGFFGTPTEGFGVKGRAEAPPPDRPSPKPGD
ncbi:hypothetical protein [Mangrovicoccus sp. HB161399]|nr:hypothetical protein [Mangrovicoccus sp. HB161399]